MTNTSALCIVLLFAGASALKVREAGAIASRKNAIFSVLVASPEHYTDSVVNQISDAAVAICSARHFGSTMQFHMDFANLDDWHFALLMNLGWTMHNQTDSIGYWKDKYKPVYSQEQAQKEGRLWENITVQQRTDGWATYFKYNAWLYEGYDNVLISDTDIVWLDNPDPILTGVDDNLLFQAFRERARKGAEDHPGLNTRLMIIKPSPTTYKELVNRSSRGVYVPFTNTEQDVLEGLFHDDDNAGGTINTFSHLHTHSDCTGLDASSEASLIAGSSGHLVDEIILNRLKRLKTCDDVWKICKLRKNRFCKLRKSASCELSKYPWQEEGGRGSHPSKKNKRHP